jgi:hypothetical protein
VGRSMNSRDGQIIAALSRNPQASRILVMPCRQRQLAKTIKGHN